MKKYKKEEKRRKKKKGKSLENKVKKIMNLQISAQLKWTELRKKAKKRVNAVKSSGCNSYYNFLVKRNETIMKKMNNVSYIHEEYVRYNDIKCLRGKKKRQHNISSDIIGDRMNDLLLKNKENNVNRCVFCLKNCNDVIIYFCTNECKNYFNHEQEMHYIKSRPQLHFSRQLRRRREEFELIRLSQIKYINGTHLNEIDSDKNDLRNMFHCCVP